MAPDSAAVSIESARGTSPTASTSTPHASSRRAPVAASTASSSSAARPSKSKALSGVRLGPSSMSTSSATGRNSSSSPSLDALRPTEGNNNGNGNDRKGKSRLTERTSPSARSTAESDNETEEERFRRVTRPPEMPGKKDWGLPSLSEEACDPALEAKVNNFLRLKLDRGQHINTTLLASTAFANPHIYTKLVEFVDIDERGSAYPDGGWPTRRHLESKIQEWGPRAIESAQEEADKRREAEQKAGNRSRIAFESSSSSSRSRRGVDGDPAMATTGATYPLLLPNAPPSSSSKRKARWNDPQSDVSSSRSDHRGREGGGDRRYYGSSSSSSRKERR